MRDHNVCFDHNICFCQKKKRKIIIIDHSNEGYKVCFVQK